MHTSDICAFNCRGNVTGKCVGLDRLFEHLLRTTVEDQDFEMAVKKERLQNDVNWIVLSCLLPLPIARALYIFSIPLHSSIYVYRRLLVKINIKYMFLYCWWGTNMVKWAEINDSVT
jgi:hypothetical protein